MLTLWEKSLQRDFQGEVGAAVAVEVAALPRVGGGLLPVWDAAIRLAIVFATRAKQQWSRDASRQQCRAVIGYWKEGGS